MALAAGVRLGPYEIIAPLGAGGMGEVYRARDSRLNREVAIKILPDAFASDPERLARFQREAQVLASLNHPNIGSIYGLEESALVLELVEGPTLADRIAHGPIPLLEALHFAQQIAEALSAAHDQGIIHRDLKPANVKVREDGTIKVLDFGLAKAFASESSSTNLSISPTITSPAMATHAGIIIGTAAYMSPEQARGKSVDKRTDIWAFGCVLYEMLTGKRAFGGDEITDVLAYIITKEPDRKSLPTDSPPAVRRLLDRCLEKDRKQRLADISDALLEIKEALATPVSTEAAGALAPLNRSARARWMPIAAAAILASALTATGIWSALRQAPPQPAPLQRLTITLPPAAPHIGAFGGELAVSPDGTRVVYSALDGGKHLLYIRALDQLDAQPLRGTDGAFDPFFSPDGEWVGFLADTSNATGTLKKVSIQGGPALPLGDAPAPHGASWGDDGTIVFSALINGHGGLHRVSASGGKITVLTTPDRQKNEIRHSWPHMLPGGKSVLFSVRPAANSSFDGAHIDVLSLETGTRTTVIEQGYHARYVTTGHIVYILSGNLMAVPFDLERLVTTGPSVPVVEGIAGRSNIGNASFDLSRTGFLVYAPGNMAASAQRTLVWADRQGHETPLGAPPRTYVYARLSPDGTRVVLDIRDQENDIWMWELASRTLSRVTSDPAIDRFPVWTPDGRQIVFTSARAGPDNVYRQTADGTSKAERLTEGAQIQYPQSFSNDGTLLVIREANTATGTGADLQTLSLVGERRVSPLVHTQFMENNGEISPDGRWLAYESNDSGQNEIYVRPFPNVDSAKWTVSSGGGTRPAWSRSGRELFYISGVGPGSVSLMAVPVQLGATFSRGDPQKLFEGRYLASVGNYGRTYDVSTDGLRFLMVKEPAQAIETGAPASLVVLLNWFDELKRLAPKAH